MARGNRKSNIFEDDDDRALFIHLLGKVAERYAFLVYGVCLMNNHYHVIGATPRGQLSDAMRFVNGVYAQASNRRHCRTGHLFEARFRSLVVQQESYLKRVARYVALNPVRARIVTRPEAWRWGSYPATAGLAPSPPWLSLDWIEWAFDTTDRNEAQRRYREYVNSPTARRFSIPERAAAIGPQGFVDKVARAANPRKSDRCLPFADRVAPRPALDVLFSSKQDPVLRATCAYRAAAHYGYRQSDIARHLGVDPSTVSKWIRRASSGTRPS
jgi:REP element-mobilizing transposase RayT